MGGRYLVSGAQLGLIAGLAKTKINTKNNAIIETIDSIVEDQFIESSEADLEDDVFKYQRKFVRESISQPNWGDKSAPEVDVTCPKCGSKDTQVKFIEKGERFFDSKAIEAFKNDDKIFARDKKEPLTHFITIKEYLQLHCRRCQYEWWEDTLDD